MLNHFDNAHALLQLMRPRPHHAMLAPDWLLPLHCPQHLPRCSPVALQLLTALVLVFCSWHMTLGVLAQFDDFTYKIKIKFEFFLN